MSSASFANKSEQRRVTLNFGFFRRSEVVGARPMHTEQRVQALCEMIPLAVAFRQHSRGAQAGEIPFVYQPHASQQLEFKWEGWDAPATVAALNAPGVGY
eukprot:COSAG02_NODE_2856_length_7888_cov_6.880216_4_plen_100_part_00